MKQCECCQAAWTKYVLCRACAADPVNADWNTGEDVGDVTDAADYTHINPSLGELAATRFAPTELQHKIVHIVAFGIIVKRRRRGRDGRSKGIRAVREYMTAAQIARFLGCSSDYVDETRRDYLKTLLGDRADSDLFAIT